MKTQILQLETYDDQVSACDKIKWSQADRILLVWPARGKILNRKLDLLLLKRQSIAQGAQLALVTRDAANPRPRTSPGHTYLQLCTQGSIESMEAATPV